MIQTKTFRTNGMGEEYSIKETCDTADKACAGKNQGSFEKYFFDMDNLESFLSVYEEVSLDRTICF